ncbi:sodium channel protein Nach-like [Nilaparvata lugens]|uniref:sodium channel protein Nach-like n=1 Tax=Nilaparvata lugens TaxID=108931 RepID=UPI00193EBDE1|nr:sodium channel protein Nach-like [Nilaparvata lugens]
MGINQDLQVVFNPQLEEYTCPPNVAMLFGTKVFIHDPRTHPTDLISDISSSMTMAAYQETTIIRLHPRIERYTTQVHNFINICNSTSIGTSVPYCREECYFRCRAAKKAHKCNCLLYHHAGITESNFSKTCSLKGWECHFRNIKSVVDNEIEAFQEEISSCECPPACESIQYRYETSSYSDEESSSSEEKESHILVFFKGEKVTLIKRSPDYPFSRLMYIVLGHISMFLGASLMSIVEVIYFFTLRLYNDLWMNEQPKPAKKKTGLDLEEICEGTKEGTIYWDEILANID